MDQGMLGFLCDAAEEASPITSSSDEVGGPVSASGKGTTTTTTTTTTATKNHRKSCHMCGNLRTPHFLCGSCPTMLCSNCYQKFVDMLGASSFSDTSCPVCTGRCCCRKNVPNTTKTTKGQGLEHSHGCTVSSAGSGSTTQGDSCCPLMYHCYRKCPSSRAQHKREYKPRGNRASAGADASTDGSSSHNGSASSSSGCDTGTYNQKPAATSKGSGMYSSGTTPGGGIVGQSISGVLCEGALGGYCSSSYLGEVSSFGSLGVLLGGSGSSLSGAPAPPSRLTIPARTPQQPSSQQISSGHSFQHTPSSISIPVRQGSRSLEGKFPVPGGASSVDGEKLSAASRIGMHPLNALCGGSGICNGMGITSEASAGAANSFPNGTVGDSIAGKSTSTQNTDSYPATSATPTAAAAATTTTTAIAAESVGGSQAVPTIVKPKRKRNLIYTNAVEGGKRRAKRATHTNPGLGPGLELGQGPGLGSEQGLGLGIGVGSDQGLGLDQILDQELTLEPPFLLLPTDPAVLAAYHRLSGTEPPPPSLSSSSSSSSSSSTHPYNPLIDPYPVTSRSMESPPPISTLMMPAIMTPPQNLAHHSYQQLPQHTSNHSSSSLFPPLPQQTVTFTFSSLDQFLDRSDQLLIPFNTSSQSILSPQPSRFPPSCLTAT